MAAQLVVTRVVLRFMHLVTQLITSSMCEDSVNIL
jgi:hypothetical protein